MTLGEDIKLELEERLERANLSKEMLEDNKQETQVIVYNIKLYHRGIFLTKEQIILGTFHQMFYFVSLQGCQQNSRISFLFF